MEVKVFWCKTNTYFAQKWVYWTDLGNQDGILIASCVVTDQAKRRWTKFALAHLKKLRNGQKLYITGCGTLRNGEIDPNFFDQYVELGPYREHIVLLPEDPPKAMLRPVGDSISDGLRGRLTRAKASILWADTTRKTVVIQTWCNNFCTFCLTVQARGRHAYRETQDVIGEISEYVRGGGKEVILTGINLWAWGASDSAMYQEGRLPDLIDAILRETSIERLRISSLWVEFVSDELVERFKNPRLHAYIHLSVQSWSEKILARMGRHYDRSKLLEVLEKLRNLERMDGVIPRIGADLIVWFPDEEESDFLDTLDLVRNHGISQVHAFPFSAHVDKYHVPAGAFPNQIPEEVKRNRLAVLLEEWDNAKRRFEELNIGKRFRLLLEGKTKWSEFSGWSENYIFLNQENFIPDSNSILRRGEVITGVFSWIGATPAWWQLTEET